MFSEREKRGIFLAGGGDGGGGRGGSVNINSWRDSKHNNHLPLM